MKTETHKCSGATKQQLSLTTVVKVGGGWVDTNGTVGGERCLVAVSVAKSTVGKQTATPPKAKAGAKSADRSRG